MSLNKVILIGNLGRDPEIRSMQSGKEIASFSIATTKKWRDKASGESKTRTDWHNVVVLSESLAALTRTYLKKGSKIYLEGALQTRKWTDKSGVEKYTTEVVLNAFESTIVMLDKKEGGGGGGYDSYDAPSGASEPAADIDDEIPF